MYAVNVSDVLNQSTNDVITDDECEVYYGANTINGGVGDSGGPLNYRTGGVTVTRGVTSFVSDGGCAGGLPDGFTRVLYQLDWIETNTGIIIDN
ncbi:hypothetical protein HAZT_HAZT010135 [Hyalella azteca]|uniref:Peptidase S1 domain-containing protein n=1 Tax=Hyalella azteca TaxID=294128 RepID=A0A6A0H429_HYAAZ|nr:hypothetical protein HAZT_HAZT010135 [Hyalella azteca]